MRHQLLILFLLFAVRTTAQSVSGSVTDARTGEPLYPVTVVNMLTQQSVYTGEDGKFTIAVKNGEQLAFTYVGYKTVQKLIGAAMQNIMVEMQPLSFQMHELVVRAQDYSPYQIDSLQRRSTYKRTLARQRSPVMSPVSFIAERLSKSSKQTFRFQKSFNYWEDQRFIDSRYSPEMVTELTGLEGDSLAAFMNQHVMPYDYARAATELELKMWIRNNYKAWIKNPVLPNIKADSLLQSPRQ